MEYKYLVRKGTNNIICVFKDHYPKFSLEIYDLGSCTKEEGIVLFGDLFTSFIECIYLQEGGVTDTVNRDIK